MKRLDEETVYLEVTVSRKNVNNVIAELHDMQDIYFVANMDPREE